MKSLLVLVGLSSTLLACTAAQEQQAYADGQLFCQYGPTVVAVAGQNVIGQSAAQVAAVCAILNAVPVPQPAGTVPATVAVKVTP